MSDKNKGCRIAADWKRPAGPLNVWRQLEAKERLAGGTTRRVRFSIQDVPEDRYDEVVEHMLKFFVADEVTCASLKLKECKDAMDDFSKLWRYLLKLGVSVGAFKLDTDGSLLELIGVNVLYVVTEELDKTLVDMISNFKCQKARKLFTFMKSVGLKFDFCQMYGADKRISALGLSVSPAFRGQKIGVRLLEARSDIGRKYGITLTETIFSGPASQIQAERAGYETIYRQKYSETFDEDGQLLFPGIKAEEMKLMAKEIR